ncbi:MAG: LuxR C-terminal-related transcriptional regulator [Bacteroidales bacterium]
MTTEIYIIHSSLIIQKGLQAVIQNISQLQCARINHPSDITNNILSYQSAKKYIVFTEKEISQEYHQAIHKMQEKNTVFTVYIIDENEPIHHNINDFFITHYSGSEEIQDIIQKIESQKNISHDNNEDSEQLSIREKEILKHVALGFANKEIAEKLFISIHTVISHRKNIVEKTGIKSIPGLTMYAIMTDIIDPKTIDISTLI